MNDTAMVIILAVIVLLVAIGLLAAILRGLVFLVPSLALLVLAFTRFVMGLSPILSILMFILFPPTLVVFLVGLALIQSGVEDRLVDSMDSEDAAINKSPDTDVSKERARRRALGYDD